MISIRLSAAKLGTKQIVELVLIKLICPNRASKPNVDKVGSASRSTPVADFHNFRHCANFP